MNHGIDPQKEELWKAEIESRREITPEELLAFFDPHDINFIDAHQRAQLSEKNIHELVYHPIPQPETDIAKIACNNEAIYDDEIEDLIDQDEILAQLQKMNKHEDATRAIRARRTVVAHYIFSCITTENQAA